ncbi:MAG: hypothetical protein QUS14_13220 [Pyrinomonadaceae bacterium]|nr:hypothetical protein [Pyrinomonadaceae bacterium]
MKKITAAILGVFLSLLLHENASAQSDEFRYQGNLVLNGQPANGSYDFEFRLFSSFVGGTQIDVTRTHPGIQVTNGLFAVSLLFDDGFTGGTRYLDISVRPAGSGSYTALTPRTFIATTPYAMRSTNAFQAANATTAETAQSAAFAEKAGSALTAGSADVAANATNATNATNAATASNALALGGLAPNQYVLTNDPRLTDTRSPAPGSTNYIQNGTTQQPASNFNISGSGTVGGNLSIGGNITIPVTTRYFSIPGVAFLPTTDAVAYDGQNARWATGGSSAAFSAPVNLPDGANITEVRLIYFRGASETISFSFRRFDPMTNTTQTIASGTGSGASCPCSLVPSLGPFTIVNNQTHSYFALVGWNVNSQFPDAHKIQGLRITYTVTAPLP